MKPAPSPATAKPLRFPDWPTRLAQDATLASAVRESHRWTLTRFLQFCRERQTAPTVARAREFVEVVRLEQAPGPARLQAWKAALNWFFQTGRPPAARTRPGVPALARADLGGPSWEQALIAGLRERHLAWRTEETYRAWLWRFVRWLGPRAVPEAGAAEVRSFLLHLAVEGRVGAATQKQALNALVWFFRKV